MSGLIALIVEFLASLAAAAKARQQAKAAEELPRGEAEIKAIGDDVAAIRAEHGDSACWVVALGTNDAWGAAGAGSAWRRTAFGWRVRAMLAEIGADHRVWWVNVATRRAGLARSFADFDAALSAVGVVVVDHAGLMAVAGGWAGDGVHRSGSGYRRRAELVAGAVG